MDEIRQLLGEDAVSTDDEILRSHGYSEWSTINIERLPVAVVFPSSTEEVSQIAKICHQSRIPISEYPSRIAGEETCICDLTRAQFPIRAVLVSRAIFQPHLVVSA